MKFSVRAQMGIQNLNSLLKFMLTTLKMIHSYIYNQGLKQNLRRNERRREISDLPREENGDSSWWKKPEITPSKSSLIQA